LHMLGTANFGPELNKFYTDADIFIFTSLSEGNPRVIIEAMAHSIPIVTTPCGSVSDHVKHNKTGLLVPFKDVVAIASAVERFITDGNLSRDCIRNAFEEVQGMTVERYITEMANYAKVEVDGYKT
jgi:glycosyltransferase involved in cell wall biosynthesis